MKHIWKSSFLKDSETVQLVCLIVEKVSCFWGQATWDGRSKLPFRHYWGSVGPETTHCTCRSGRASRFKYTSHHHIFLVQHKAGHCIVSIVTIGFIRLFCYGQSCQSSYCITHGGCTLSYQTEIWLFSRCFHEIVKNHSGSSTVEIIVCRRLKSIHEVIGIHLR